MSVTRNAAIAYVTGICDLQKLKHGEDQHTVPEWIIITRRQLQKAEDAWYVGRKTEALHRLAHVAACGVTAVEQNGEGPKTEDAQTDGVTHGIDCPKMPHLPHGGYLHGENDDGQYTDDGVRYCGRCHAFLT